MTSWLSMIKSQVQRPSDPERYLAGKEFRRDLEAVPNHLMRCPLSADPFQTQYCWAYVSTHSHLRQWLLHNLRDVLGNAAFLCLIDGHTFGLLQGVLVFWNEMASSEAQKHIHHCRKLQDMQINRSIERDIGTKWNQQAKKYRTHELLPGTFFSFSANCTCKERSQKLYNENASIKNWSESPRKMMAESENKSPTNIKDEMCTFKNLQSHMLQSRWSARRQKQKTQNSPKILIK